MTYQRKFIVGKTYLRADGKPVKITAVHSLGPHCQCVQGDDGEDVIDEDVGFVPGSLLGWRYDRESDPGRVCGSAFDMSDPRNLIPGSEQP